MEIEAAGWRVIDHGTDFQLVPAFAPTVEADGQVRYGHAGAVPSLLDEPADADFSVHLMADDRPDELERALASMRAHAPAGTQVVIVANDPSPDQAGRLAADRPALAPIGGRAPEVLWTSTRLGAAAARNVGLRRATGAIVILADASVEISGDALSPLATVLVDPAVAVAGAFGLVTTDLRHFVAAAGPTVEAVEGAWLACRREDVARLGPLDERFVSDRYLDAWWSLVLRAGPDPEGPPRSARRMGLPLVRHEEHRPGAAEDTRADRLANRNSYRLLERFRDRAGDLLSGAPAAGPSTATGS